MIMENKVKSKNKNTLKITDAMGDSFIFDELTGGVLKVELNIRRSEDKCVAIHKNGAFAIINFLKIYYEI